jgi:hypothetical protein
MLIDIIPMSVLLTRLSPLLIWLACHFVGDFAFQSTWMSVEKGKSWEVNFYHCATYTATFVLFGGASLVAAIWLLITHYIVDTLKARYKVIGSIWLDQLLHVVTLVGILLFVNGATQGPMLFH